MNGGNGEDTAGAGLDTVDGGLDTVDGGLGSDICLNGEVVTGCSPWVSLSVQAAGLAGSLADIQMMVEPA